MKKILILLLVISTNLPTLSYSDDAVVLNKDDKAPFRGILLSPKKAAELNDTEIERDSLLKSLSLYKNNQELYEKRSSTLLEQNDKLATQLYSARQTSDWEKVLWFGLGAVLTGLTGYGIYRAAK